MPGRLFLNNRITGVEMAGYRPEKPLPKTGWKTEKRFRCPTLGAALLLPLPRYQVYCFCRAALNPFVSYNQSTPIHAATNISIRVVPNALWGGLRHTLSPRAVQRNTGTCLMFLCRRILFSRDFIGQNTGLFCGRIYSIERRHAGSATSCCCCCCKGFGYKLMAL